MRRERKLSAQTVAVVMALGEDSAGWCHGYDLCRRLELKAGTVYPILMRLAERGQVETTWETDPPSGRPARHLYRLSADGRELAAQLREVPAEVRATPRTRPALGGAS